MLVATVCPSPGAADPPTRAAACARCIGDLCMRPKQMSDEELIRRYGPGEKHETNEGGLVDTRTRCYFDRPQKLWVLADIYHNNDPPRMYVVGVHVSREPLCGRAVPPRKPFRKLALPTGLAVGDSELSTVRQCGQPQRIDDTVALERKYPRSKDEPGFGSRFGQRKLAYFPEGEDSLLALFIQVTEGKVISLWLNDSP